MTPSVRETIQKVAKRKNTFNVQDIRKVHPKEISRQRVSEVLSDLVESGSLIKTGNTRRTIYSLPENATKLGLQIRRKFKNDGTLEEHKILNDILTDSSFNANLKENVRSIFDYAFSEIFNNAIEHSKSDRIQVCVEIVNNFLEFSIKDFGIGIFKNIKSKLNLESELDAIGELLKGKTTTMPQTHSGEGVFFTSKVADIFEIRSYGYRLDINNIITDLSVREEGRNAITGTEVNFSIDCNSSKHLNTIFEEYQTEPEAYAFDKTKILVRLYSHGSINVSRSQARRILSGLEKKYKEIVFDFNKVASVGQAFADEIFRVFKNKHPEIKLVPINMNEAVNFMVSRAQNSSISD